jgi:DNA-3-methyladenine glycosylase
MPPADPLAVLDGRSTDVAPWLLGAHLTSFRDEGSVTVRITEVEAYEGIEDPASHGHRGPTPRTQVMFGPSGRLYVYFVYGMHWCANVVCGPAGLSSALLIRAGEIVDGVELARARRTGARRDVDLARGPARLARALALTGSDTGSDLGPDAGPIRLALPQRAAPAIATGPRVGIRVATERPWRYWLPGEATVTAFRPATRRRVASARQTGAL